MLLLTRKLGEKIIINDDIIIHVTKLGNYQVMLGFEAPDNIKINREEVYNKIKEKESGGNY